MRDNILTGVSVSAFEKARVAAKDYKDAMGAILEMSLAGQLTPQIEDALLSGLAEYAKTMTDFAADLALRKHANETSALAAVEGAAKSLAEITIADVAKGGL